MSQSFLESSHAYRYEKGISPEERTSKSASSLNDHRKRDVFSLGVLIEEVLTSIVGNDSTKSDEQNGDFCQFLLKQAKTQLRSCALAELMVAITHFLK
jgi:hypothetical protein